MFLTTVIIPDYLQLIIVPLLIFFARILDVSIGTIRIIMIARGHKYVAPLLGFFEVFIWLLAMRAILKNIDAPINFLAYCSGFAMGNYVGIVIEQKLAMGMVIIRIITRQDPVKLLEKLRDQGFSVTSVPADGLFGPVKILFSVVKRRNISKVLDLVKTLHPNAFYTIEDIGTVSKPLNVPMHPPKKRIFHHLRLTRK